MTRVAILNSRQSKTPVGNDPWVKATLAAVGHAASHGWTVVSSFGLNTWELVTWAAGRCQAPLVLLYPEDFSPADRDQLLDRFGLSANLVEWVPVIRGERRSVTKNWWEHRDTLIVEFADQLLPISIRRGGRIGALLTSAGKPIDGKFRVPYTASSHHARDTVDTGRMSPEISDWGDNWLIHWTRTCHGLWPGELEAEFYSKLVVSGEHYCHSAFHTLQRILNESLLRGSSWRIGADTPVVAFTELSPMESLKLMRWRPRWSRWSFEPYGIAIHRSVAESLGVRPIDYIEAKDWRRIPVADKPFTHSKGKSPDIWPAEREWRFKGNLPLNEIMPEHIRIITKSQLERNLLKSDRGMRVLSFEQS